MSGLCQLHWVTPAGCGPGPQSLWSCQQPAIRKLLFRFHESLLYFQAKEATSKQKEFEETAKQVRCAIEQLGARK